MTDLELCVWVKDRPLRALSLGAGVQSSCMALMSSMGEIERVDLAIFCDTQGESAETYRWLDWLEGQLSFPVVRVTAGSLAEDSLRLRHHQTKEGTYANNKIPAFMVQPDGSRGLLGRRCTVDYKVIPFHREVKRLLGGRKRGDKTAESWIGISTDEAHRMKPTKERSIINRWPLIEENMSRRDCLAWMEAKGFPRPPRSSCTFCPFHSDQEWVHLRENSPDEFASVVQFEKSLQETCASATLNNLHGVPFLHPDGVPLDTVDFDKEDAQMNLFGNECEGMCGV